eukprot:TRINITY_DN9369_c0_g1_i1.p1 TRINITY_DN9369_c0_g1~~TRINITY_DN9369_c0_g1_i1.p1  ORF type:complete len:425 (+),score=73.89 TRINITY_DN9369_c0_g1_i1:80-1354(+)
MEASDELISVVAATTGCTPSEARLALDAAGGSPDLAVEFLLENSGANQNTGVSQNIQSDEELAASMQESMYSEQAAVEGMDDDGVRDAIPQQKMRLVDDTYQTGSRGSVDHLLSRREYLSDPNAFRNLDHEERMARTGNVSTSALSNLFEPPYEILFQGPFSDVVSQSQRDQKWIIINIINAREFDSQCQNRDVWKNLSLQRLIKSSFIFFQTDVKSPEGASFCSTFGGDSIPCIHILDPHSGSSMINMSGKCEVGEVMACLSSFLDSHPSPDTDVKPHGPRETNWSRNISTSAVTLDTDSEFEFEDLDTDDERGSTPEPEPRSPRRASLPEQVAPSQPLPREEVEEPQAGPGVVRVQIRLPQGKRIVRRFRETDTVKTLRLFIQSEITEAFNIILPPATRLEDETQSLVDAKVAGSAITVSLC